MSIEIKIPSPGESITEVVIETWLKADGDYVELDEVLCEIETDKATLPFPSEVAGILKIIIPEGEEANVGDVLCTIDPEGVAASETPQAAAVEAEDSVTTGETPVATIPQVSATGKITEIKIPSPGESITEVVIETWLKADGDYVQLDEVLCEIETDKATLPFPSEVAGILKIVLPEGAEAKVGDVLCTIADAETPTVPAANTTESMTEESPESPSSPLSYASGTPSVAAAKIIAERDLSPEEIQGTGKAGRITKADALAVQKSEPSQLTSSPIVSGSAPPPVSKSQTPPAPSVPSQEAAGMRNTRREKMTRIRKKISERLVSVKNETAMLTTFNEVDMQSVMELRSKYKDGFLKKHNVKLGFMSFFTKACTEALRDFPAVNGMIDQGEIVFHDYVDMGIAVSAPRGLVVPVIRNAESLTLAQIEAEIVRLATKARDNKLSIDEMSGGTFSITNGGIFGSMLSTPIINPPQSAILGMHNIVQRPLAVNGKVEIRPVMYLALSYDHRIIDGRESVSFLVKVKEYLEDPARLLLGV
ncbi:MAG: 2-oxoglutarate dehydrogenase complex dihydrolipoyllysine-residue succinyltransferase [SAR324 cluster bacterium]|nr:2-oxoglutarate dehydrogenase complex dihydrolipoyllysine-residue succinyltransferase [SAR324 cluster bacterium]